MSGREFIATEADAIAAGEAYLRNPRGITVFGPSLPPEEVHAYVLHLLERGEAGFGPVKAALVRIAERHGPEERPAYVSRDSGGENTTVTACAAHDLSPWPCPDFRDVAAAVGIEVPE